MIKYREGYKYQLAQNHVAFTPITPDSKIVHEFFELDTNGILIIKSGYAWDGASGPTIDTAASMRPSLVHDVFCQMMRAKMLPFERWRHIVNQLFYQHCLDAGMWRFRAKIWLAAVEFANAGDPSQGESNPIQTAP